MKDGMVHLQGAIQFSARNQLPSEMEDLACLQIAPSWAPLLPTTVQAQDMSWSVYLNSIVREMELGMARFLNADFEKSPRLQWCHPSDQQIHHLRPRDFQLTERRSSEGQY